MSALDLAAVIERRLLINYRVDPAVAAALLPAGLRPQLVDGSAVAGVCLIRMRTVRPAALPLAAGWSGEAAAHRVAVEWDAADGRRTGVFIPVRQSGSRLPVLAGGRLVPGVHRRARFDVHEAADRYRVSVDGPDERVAVEVRGPADRWSSGLFPTLTAASEFFRGGSTGWSPSRADGLEALVLGTDRWRVEPAEVLDVRSSFFDRLPSGSAVLDGALLMREVPVRWTRPSGDARPTGRSEVLAA